MGWRIQASRNLVNTDQRDTERFDCQEWALAGKYFDTTVVQKRNVVRLYLSGLLS